MKTVPAFFSATLRLRRALAMLTLATIGLTGQAAPPPLAAWQALSDPTAASVAAGFQSPPPEYSAQFTWGWSGAIDRGTIGKDLDGMKALGVRAAIIEPKSGMPFPYLSSGYFDLVKVAVEEAKKRDMRLWIMDDGDYPSGLAGGKFTEERPDLRMQVLAPAEHVALESGQTFSRTLTADDICAVAVNRDDGIRRVLPLDAKRGVNWTVPAGHWELAIARRVYRTLPTRSANTPTGAKDTTHSLMDYLDPAATALFAAWTFDQYQKVIGDEFGKTVLGFRGDEPAYGLNPWTPKLLEEFSKRKGYDLSPYLPAISVNPREAAFSDEERRVYADYCDVWSDLFRDSYFNTEAAWCAERGLEMQLHIEHEEILPQLALTDGDYFKCFRNIQVPGIDIIWHQLWMDNPAEFPRLASSAAHLYGHPRAMCEAFAAYRPPPDLHQAKWLLDFLLVHGVNRIEYMFWPSSAMRRPRATEAAANAIPPTASGGPGSAPVSTSTPDRAAPAAGSSTPARAPGAGGGAGGPGGGGNRYYRDPGFPAVAAYVNRLSYLLGEGRPASQIALYVPTSSYWITDRAASESLDHSFLTIAHQLVEHQRDFDFVDEQALSSVLKIQGNRLVNLSGQGYAALLVPPSVTISRAAVERLRAFAAVGGKVIFLGSPPKLMADKNFLHAGELGDLSWASLREEAPTITSAVLAQLPKPDFASDQASPTLSYNHRRLKDSDVYFIFNYGEAALSRELTLVGSGSAQTWDAQTGAIAPLQATAGADGAMRVHLALEPWSTTTIVIGPATGATSPAVAVSN